MDTGCPWLTAIADGPYLCAASWLDSRDLCRVDATCKLLRTVHRLPAGPWFDVGSRAFLGLEVDLGGRLESFEASTSGTAFDFSSPGRHPATPSRASSGRREHDWKKRAMAFHQDVRTFSLPFHG